VSLRATGANGISNDKIGRAPDHNTGQWSLWLGRPLLAQWTHEVRVALDQHLKANPPLPVTVIGQGPAGVVALCAAALEPRIKRVVSIGSLASYITEVAYEGQRIGLLAPGIVRDVGDIPQLAALIAPRPLIIAGAVNASGATLEAGALREQFAFPRRIYQLQKANAALTLLPSTSTEAILRALE